jgi:hypothetical protein
MNRRTFDVLLPLAYLIAITLTWYVSQNPTWVGGVSTIGALVLAAYYLALRQNLPARPRS